MSKDNENKKNKKKDNKISKRKNSSSPLSAKKKIPSWLPDNLLPNKRNKKDKEKKIKLRWKNKDYNKLRRNLFSNIKKSKNKNNCKRKNKKKG